MRKIKQLHTESHTKQNENFSGFIIYFCNFNLFYLWYTTYNFLFLFKCAFNAIIVNLTNFLCPSCCFRNEEKKTANSD